MKLATHNGIFHADDIISASILTIIDPSASITRTRDIKTLKEADIVFDVGCGKYDHHFVNAEARVWGITYSSAGLIWRDYGRNAIRVICGDDVSVQDIEAIWKRIDDVILIIDASDNGLSMYKPLFNDIGHIETLSSIISGFNPSWNENISSDLAFLDAVKFAVEFLKRKIKEANSWCAAKNVVLQAIECRKDNRVLVLPCFCPWKEHLKNAEVDTDDILYVVFHSNNQYSVQAVPTGVDGFEMKKPLPESWAGKRDEELADITGIADSVFCHPARFICAAKSLESAIRMATLAADG